APPIYSYGPTLAGCSVKNQRAILASDINVPNNCGMKLQTLSAFVAVAQEGSLTRAAHKLHITQPAVGLHIKNLQEQTGLVLLSRTGRGMQLTPDGSALLPLAEKVLQSQIDFKAAALRL